MMDEQSVFLAALEKTTPGERAAYLEEACRGNSAFRQRIESLLKRHGDAGSFLERPPEECRETEQVGDARCLETPAEGECGADGENTSQQPSLRFLSPSQKAHCLGVLGQYEVDSLIGAGGMGLVLKAYDVKLHRAVAIKVLSPDLAANSAAKQRFLREARAAAAITSPQVVTIHAVDELPVPHLVMELVDGKTLTDKLAQVGTLGVKEVLRIGWQVALGLAAAHKQGLVHRDIKPANILLENGIERVKLTDFGLARAVDDRGVTRTGEVAGTPHYMSPEQARGARVDHRSDLFSLGSVLYTMCTGDPPFRGEHALAVIRSVADDAPRPLEEVNPEIPEWLCGIVTKLLSKRPGDRYQTASEVAAILRDHLARLQNATSSTAELYVERPEDRPRRSPALSKQGRPRRRWWLAAALTGTVVVLSSAVMMMRKRVPADVKPGMSDQGKANLVATAASPAGEERPEDLAQTDVPKPSIPDASVPSTNVAEANLPSIGVGKNDNEVSANSTDDGGVKRPTLDAWPPASAAEDELTPSKAPHSPPAGESPYGGGPPAEREAFSGVLLKAWSLGETPPNFAELNLGRKEQTIEQQVALAGDFTLLLVFNVDNQGSDRSRDRHGFDLSLVGDSGTDDFSCQVAVANSFSNGRGLAVTWPGTTTLQRFSVSRGLRTIRICRKGPTVTFDTDGVIGAAGKPMGLKTIVKGKRFRAVQLTLHGAETTIRKVEILR